MTRTWTQLQREAAAEGFPADSLEKVLHLIALLDGLRSHPYLRTRLALKGGTALSLFELDLPRLSVDIDLNYVGSADRETMLAERPEVEAAIEAVCRRLDLVVKRVPAHHAGGKWRLGYRSAAGGTGTLELDLNFVLRVPLWPVVLRAARPVAGEAATSVASRSARVDASPKSRRPNAVHSSCCSMSSIPTRRRTDALLGKMPTTRVRRRSSSFRRSIGFVDRI